MTRLVSLFFMGVGFLLVVYWVIPGAETPSMTAVKPLVPTTTVHVAEPARPAVPPAGPRAAPLPLAAEVTPPPAAEPPPALRPTARAATACDGDPIRCLLEGGHPADPTDVTGSISPATGRLPNAARRPAGRAPGH